MGPSIPRHFVQDGDLLTDQGSHFLEAARFIKVPLLIGSNRNDGSSLVQPDIKTYGVVNKPEDLAKIVVPVAGGNPLPDEAINTWWGQY